MPCSGLRRWGKSQYGWARRGLLVALACTTLGWQCSKSYTVKAGSEGCSRLYFVVLVAMVFRQCSLAGLHSGSGILLFAQTGGEQTPVRHKAGPVCALGLVLACALCVWLWVDSNMLIL